MKPGRFLTLEGVEGVGKSTNLNFIVEYLTERGVDLVQTREPGGTPAGESIRELLLDPATTLTPEAELLMMFASRIELVQTVIQPAIERGAWVISDRFTDASHAYQGGGRQLGESRVAAIEQWALGSFKPDRTLFLDLPVERGMERVASRGQADRFEQQSTTFFDRVHAAYQQRIAEDVERFRVIDASQTLPQVQQQIAAVLDIELATAGVA